MFKWISYLLIGITFLGNIQGIKNKSYIWRFAGLNDPYFMQLDSTGKKIINCMHYEVLKIIQDKLDFRYELVQPIPRIFGRKEENGTWTGMTGQIFSKKADISVFTLFITQDRFQAMDFPTSFVFHQVQFIVKTGGHESNWNSIIRPFSFELWISLFILTVIFGILLHQVMKCESSNETGPFLSFPTVIWYLFGTLALQGGNLCKVYRIPSRFSIGLWLLAVVILVSSYSGNLMSFMTSPIFEFVPTTFDELASSVRNGEFACGTFKDDAIAAFLMGSKTGNAKILADHMISNNNFYNAEESIERVLKGKYAFLSSNTIIAKIQKSNEFGELLRSEDALVTFPASYGLRKGFPYKKHLDKILSRLLQSGIVDKFANLEQSVERQSTAEFRPLIIEDFLSPFVLLFTGYVLSFICIVIELIIATLLRL